MLKINRYFIFILLMVFSLVHGNRGVGLAATSKNQKSIIPILSYLLLQTNTVKMDNYVAMGDSITVGTIYDPSHPDANPYYYTIGGYVPLLTTLLTSSLGYPVMMVNEGIAGDISAEGLALISSLLENNPDSQRFLVCYGTNDANSGIPSGKGLTSDNIYGYPGSFKDNMQQIIDAVKAEGKDIFLAKPPIMLGSSSVGDKFNDINAGNSLLREYIVVIDELIAANNITIAAPDLYLYFSDNYLGTENPRYSDQYSDNLHPNAIGYQSIAELWHQALMEGN